MVLQFMAQGSDSYSSAICHHNVMPCAFCRAACLAQTNEVIGQVRGFSKQQGHQPLSPAHHQAHDSSRRGVVDEVFEDCVVPWCTAGHFSSSGPSLLPRSLELQTKIWVLRARTDGRD